MEIGEISSKVKELFGAKEKPQIHCSQMLLDGRAGQDGIKTDTIEESRELNKLKGIFFMAGVFDGHGGEKNTGQQIAQIAFENFQYYLTCYLRQKRDANLTQAIKEASYWTDKRLLGFSWWQNQGVCFEMAIAAPDGLYLAHLGDGRAYLDKGGKIELLTTPHKPPEGRVGGVLAVNRSWGDGDVKKAVGIKALSPYPDVIKLKWKELRGASLLLTTDGLPSLSSVVGKNLIPKTFQNRLDQNFQREIENLMNLWNQMYHRGQIRSTADDVSCLLLEFK